MKKLKENQNGFSAVEVIMALVIAGLIGFIGWYVYTNNNKTEVKSTPESASQQRKAEKQTPYLSIPEAGIKFELTSEIDDAYYYKSEQGYIYLSTRQLDTTKGAEGCAARDTDGLGGGLVSLVVGKVGEPNDSVASGDPWTQEELENSGLMKLGDTYYGFMKGNGPCFDPDNNAAADMATSATEAFVKQQSTITKL